MVSCAGIGSVEVSEITPYGQYVSHPFKCQTSITYQVCTYSVRVHMYIYTHVHVRVHMYIHVHVHVVHSEDPVICECLLNDVDSFSVRLHSTLWDDHTCIIINLHIPVHEHVCMTCTCTCKMHFSGCPSTANEAWDWPKCILHS